MRLKDKVAIITGGANGIGLAACKKFLAEGAKVIMADFDEQSGNVQVNLLRELGHEITFLKVDVTDRGSVDLLIANTLKTYGAIDILINNAGITRDSMLLKMEPSDFQRVLDVNINGVFNCTQAVVPHFIEKSSGKIINTSSVTGVYGNVGQTNYAASKAAVIGMTKSWAKEFGRKGIQVNAVAPGFISTSMVEKIPQAMLEKMASAVSLQRLGQPEDVANAYLFLASNEADYITGQTIQVDGGLIM